jgi:glycosyltransferase involved in cell wall biosynthesis
MKKISIITPVYNGAKYIRACLKNFADQQCPEAEHLIMDGGSNDGTVEIIQEWSAHHANVRLISEKDKGQSDAMNKGIRMAEGNIISFLNVDDYYEPGVLNRVLNMFTDLPEPSFVCSNLNIWNGDGNLRHLNKPDRLSLPEILSNCFEWPYNPAAYFYHKSLHNLTGPYNSENHYCMDYEFLISAASATRLLYVNELWGNFVVGPDSKTQNAHGELQKAFNAGEAVREAAITKLNAEQRKELEAILVAHNPLLLPKKEPAPTFFQRLKKIIRSKMM